MNFSFQIPMTPDGAIPVHIRKWFDKNHIPVIFWWRTIPQSMETTADNQQVTLISYKHVWDIGVVTDDPSMNQLAQKRWSPDRPFYFKWWDSLVLVKNHGFPRKWR